MTLARKLDDDETEDRLEKMGYDKNLPDDKVRLVENPKKFMEEYIESILGGKTKDNEIVSKEEEQNEEKEINPIVLKQLKALKNTLNSNDLSINDILKHLKDNE
jgi:Trk K+ transport system NAD-binding subunit